MILHCPACGAQYDVPADAAANPRMTLRCTTCETMFSAAQGLGAGQPARTPGSMTGRLPPPRGLAQSTGGVDTVMSGPRALPPTNLPATFRDPPPPSSPSGSTGVPGGASLPPGFREGVFESQAAVAASNQSGVPRNLDSLPVSRGVNYESQSSKAVAAITEQMGLPTPGVPVQPIDAEAYFDEGPDVDSQVGSQMNSLSDVPQPSSFDSSELDAVPERSPLPQELPPSKPTTGGIRRISPDRTRSSSAAVPAAPAAGVGPSDSMHDTGSPTTTSECSPVFRRSDLEGETGMDLHPALSARVRRTRTAGEEPSGLKCATKQIDPLVEFHDVFQDIRRAEKGDERTATERYFDSGLFSEVGETTPESEEKARREREEREARLREGRLDLKAGAGGLAQRIERQVAQPEAGPDGDDDVLAAALAESGLPEPSRDHELAQEELKRAVVDLDAAGDSATTTVFPNAARYLGVLLVFGLATSGFLGFVAARNGGLIDFSAFGQMVAVAFQGGTYEPRHQTIVQVVQSAEGWVENELEAMPSNDGNALAVGELVGGQYAAGHGAVFTLVDGTVTNLTDRAYRSAFVEVTLTNDVGEVHTTRRVPVGPRIEQPQLESIVDEAALSAEYDRVAGLFADVELAPGSVATFSAVFLLEDGSIAEELTFGARVVDAERALDSCWAGVEFSTPEDIVAASDE